MWDLVSNGSCKEESCYYGTIYSTLPSDVPLEEKGEKTVDISLLEEYTEPRCICPLVCACVCVCVVLPQRLGPGGGRFSAERAVWPRSASPPRAEAPKASRAAPTSPEETKGVMRLIAPTCTTLVKYIETYYWMREITFPLHQQFQTTKLETL